jgi:hypothetical protein
MGIRPGNGLVFSYKSEWESYLLRSPSANTHLRLNTTTRHHDHSQALKSPTVTMQLSILAISAALLSASHVYAGLSADQVVSEIEKVTGESSDLSDLTSSVDIISVVTTVAVDITTSRL